MTLSTVDIISNHKRGYLCAHSLFLDHLSSPSRPRRGGGLALRWRLLGSHPPPPCCCGGCNFRSSLWPCRNCRTSSGEALRRCIKLQKPPRLHSPFSFWRQQASRKSVTGDNSAYNGRPWYTVSISIKSEHNHTYLRTNAHCSCLLLPVLLFPIRNAHKRCQLDGLLRCHRPFDVWRRVSKDEAGRLTCSSSRWPNLANSQ